VLSKEENMKMYNKNYGNIHEAIRRKSKIYPSNQTQVY
jgi:hypothetical protein